MLERLSWKRLALELFLACIPALILGGVCGSSAVVFTGGSDRFADLAFLEFDAPVVVAVGGPEHDSSAWPRQLGAAAVWSAPDADA
ncbi:phosphate regulon sensor protein PhoR [Klebsiella pneumoniae]|uniref:Phosphate regulon sensor protein PhoR n=1 Tax=Klebsiella pneumoniae TaxID=573 RepID=A0A447S117_KLEPN|nr:phosphate regulon sensor protein PhoR [Klebsiella pneumoniae]